MDKNDFKKLIRECIKEVLVESLHPSSPHLEGDGTNSSKQTSISSGNNLGEENPLYVEYHSQRQGEEPFMMHGTKYEYVNAKYPNGKIDIGVYSFAEDLVYSYDSFRQRHNIKEGDNKIKSPPTPNVPKGWGDMNPVSRIHGQGKQGHKPKYDRNRDKNWKRDLNENDIPQIPPETPYGVLDLHTKQIVFKTTYANRNRARRFADKKDLEYGAHRYSPGVIKNEIQKESTVKEMTGTSAAQGFYGKNWVDPDPDRKRMKSIAAKSVGGKVT